MNVQLHVGDSGDSSVGTEAEIGCISITDRQHQLVAREFKVCSQELPPSVTKHINSPTSSKVADSFDKSRALDGGGGGILGHFVTFKIPACHIANCLEICLSILKRPISLC